MEYHSVPTPMSATVSACLSLEKYFCSFSNKISCVISESIPVLYFEDEEKRCFCRFLTRKNDIFAFQNIAITPRETRRKEILTYSVSGSPAKLYNKRNNKRITSIKPNNCGLPTADCRLPTADWGLRTADCGLRTVDNGFKSTPPWKNSSTHSLLVFLHFWKRIFVPRQNWFPSTYRFPIVFTQPHISHTVLK